MAENNIPERPAAPLPTMPMVAFFAVFFAALTANDWANAPPVPPLATYLANQAKTIGIFLILFAVSALANKHPLLGLRGALYLLPGYLVGQIPAIAAQTVGWEGGWLLGFAGAVVGAAAGAAAGWLITRWSIPNDENVYRGRRRAILLPASFAVLLGLFGAYSWGIEWVTPENAWVIAVGWVLLALPGLLVGRPLLGLLVMSPFALVAVIPPLASMAVDWQGGWLAGFAGIVAGAAAGAAIGWMFDRWIMPEYDKRRERERAGQTPTATDEATPADPGAELCPTCSAPMTEKGALYCKHCGAVRWPETVGVLVLGLVFMGLGGLVMLGSYRIASEVAAWLVYLLGASIMAICAALNVAILSDVSRARQAQNGGGDKS